MHMLRQFLLLYICLTLYSCSGQDCSDIPKVFSSYQQAENLIGKSTFLYSDNVNTSKSSWIRGASFYSCDKEVGYFIVVTDRQEYIHQDLPIQVWENFKSASSFGAFYNQNIKNRYQLKLQ